MLKGNISNQQAPIIAFNLDNLLFKEEEQEKGLKKLIYTFFPKKKVVNENFIDIINNVWMNHDLSIYLMTLKTDFSEYEQILDEYCALYTRIHHYTGIANLRRLVEYRFDYYVDNDWNILNQIGKKAIHIDELHKYLKTGGR